ncbi:MAG: NAD(P)-binding domain-containing protein [Thermoanaerobaculum sp.]|nr:NAD(P)-binding domain-containing protein [Thermoanaerobaculum sp.]
MATVVPLTMAQTASSRRVLVPEKLARTLIGEFTIPAEALVSWAGELPPAEAIHQATAAILWHRHPGQLCRHLLQHKRRWDWMHSLWTGIEHLPVTELHRAVRVLTTGKGTGALPLAEWVLLALLWHAKRVQEILEGFQRGQWPSLELAELEETTVVLVGLGAVGRRIARLLAACGARVVGVARRVRRTPGCAQVVPLSELQSVCRQARALVLVLPATPSTAGLVDAKLLSVLPDGALVVNVGRAVVVDEQALWAEVASGRLWAALDVWWTEPLPAESPWRHMAQLLPSPHNAYRTTAAVKRHAQRVAANLQAYLRGTRMRAVVSAREWREILAWEAYEGSSV